LPAVIPNRNPIMTPKAISRIFQLLTESLPDPQTELNFDGHFQLLVAVILSAQATDVSVNRVTASLFKTAASPEAMISLGENGIKQHIKSIGLANNKARNVFKTSKMLVEKHQSQVPQTRTELEALPGVGRKTAGVVLNVAFGEATIPVDTHVFRVSNRLGLVATKTPTETEIRLLKIVPRQFLPKAHHLLILHGRYTCKARKPACAECCVKSLCKYPEKAGDS
jgi:endonuclease III